MNRNLFSSRGFPGEGTQGYILLGPGCALVEWVEVFWNDFQLNVAQDPIFHFTPVDYN